MCCDKNFFISLKENFTVRTNEKENWEVELNIVVHVPQLSCNMLSIGAWCILKEYYDKATLRNKVQLMRKICSLKLSEGGNMKQHISDMTIYLEKRCQKDGYP